MSLPAFTALSVPSAAIQEQMHTWQSDISTNSTSCLEPWERAGFQSALEAKTAFFDNLSKVPLCRSALKELNRRNLLATSSGSKAAPSIINLVEQRSLPDLQINRTNQSYLREVKNFAKRGGPDLCDLRGVRRKPDLMIKANELFTVSRAYGTKWLQHAFGSEKNFNL